ncbi:MAG TPA: hypothetical protein VL225_11555 [Vicinamibacterales bacterium]|nr:hypothetical protein [Vicinamibacterales bacterium]
MGAIVLAGLAVAAVAVFVMLALVGLVVRMALRLVLLPLLLIKWIVIGIVMLVVGPILLLIGLAGFLAVALGLALPLLPLIAVAALIWFLVRANRRRPAVV